MRSQRGFTLLEVLLALAIMALTSFVVVINIPTSANDESEQQARQLYHRVQLMQDEALLSGQEFGIEVSSARDKLTLLGLTQDGWQPLDWPKMKSDIVINDDVVLDFSLASGIWENDDRLFISQSFESDDTSLFEEQPNSEESSSFAPQILIMSSGEITAFSLRFDAKNNQNSGWIVAVADNGELTLVTLSEVEDE
jgi:general secretion pathway protein H